MRCEQARVAQAQTKEETQRLHSDVEGVLRAQLSATQEMNQATLDSVATELMQRFESGLIGDRERL